MTGRRFKVWTRDPDGQPGALLLRTGSGEQLDADVGEVQATPGEVALMACGRCVIAGSDPPRVVLVKDFDSERCYTVHLSRGGPVVVEGWNREGGPS